MKKSILLSKDFERLKKLIKILEHFQKIEEKCAGYMEESDNMAYVFDSNDFNFNTIKRLLTNSNTHVMEKEITNFGQRIQDNTYEIFFSGYKILIKLSIAEVLFATIDEAEYQCSFYIKDSVSKNNKELIEKLKSTVEKEIIYSKMNSLEDSKFKAHLELRYVRKRI